LKSLELQPTIEQVKRTYCQNTIGRNYDLHRFVEILNTLDDGCVIALDGNWGSGKTFFVKQAKMILDAHNPLITLYEKGDDEVIKNVWKNSRNSCVSELTPQIAVYYDAWENDNDDDPLLSIVYEILKTVDSDYSFKANVGLVKSAAIIAELLTGKKVQSLIEAVKQADPFACIRNGQDLRESISEFFNSLLPEQGNRLVVFIDELDRCTPNFAVRLLERIKHYFFKDNITFVLSVNTHELQNTVKHYYGNEFDAFRYLDRFFDIRINLPPADLQQYYHCIEFENTSYTYDMVAHEVIRQYHFELREIAKYIRLIKIAAYAPTHNNRRYDFSFSDGKGLQFCLLAIVPIMIGLKMHDSTRYKAFVEGKDVSPLIEIMEKDDLGINMCNSLLGNKEIYEETQEGKVTVRLNDKLEEVYNALFNQNYQSRVYKSNIGEMSFDKETKKILMQTVSLLSRFADYS